MEEKVKHPGSENLIPTTALTEEERRELAQKAGKASGEARRKKKMMREAMELVANMKPTEAVRKVLTAYGIPSDEQTMAVAAAMGVAQEAVKGNPAAFNAMRDIMGEKPVDETQLSGGLDTNITIGFVNAGVEPASDESEVDV